MKMQKLFVVSLTTLWAAGVALSQPPAPASRAAEVAGSTVVTKILTLKYYPANELSSLLQELFHWDPMVMVVPDQRANAIILTAPGKQMEEILHVVQALDVENTQAQQAQYLTCRVYMLELPSRDRNLKPFSVLLEGPCELPAAQVLAGARDPNVQITTLLQRTEGDRCELVIEGRAISNKALQQVLAKWPDHHITQLKWDEEDFTAAVPAAQVSRLPASLQEHIRRFLGEEVRTVGYWFGNLSIPGDLNAPIGPWRLDMKTQSGPGSDLVLEVRVTRESPLPFVNETQLFSNTVQGKVGRPILIGYNRDSYGTRVMGAMVILLEPDTTAPPAGPAKPSQNN